MSLSFAPSADGLSLALQIGGVTKATIGQNGITPESIAQKLTLGTAQATTSGTFKDFTGIPSWVKRITVNLVGVSTNGTASMILQLGAGSILTSGYSGSSDGNVAVNFSTGFSDGASNAAYIRHGTYVLTLVGSNTWVLSGLLGASNAAATARIVGSVSLSGALDRIRLTTANGTDAFDAGSVNIMYE